MRREISAVIFRLLGPSEDFTLPWLPDGKSWQADAWLRRPRRRHAAPGGNDERLRTWVLDLAGHPRGQEERAYADSGHSPARSVQTVWHAGGVRAGTGVSG